MSTLSHFRANKDEFMRTHAQSPIPHDARMDFDGLAYFPEAPDLRMTLEVQPADGSRLTVQTSDGQEREYERYGVVTFEVDGEPASLTLYSTPEHGHGLFLPFRDATSGKETYGAGRYIDVDLPEHGEIVLDFNYAYNPYCAYDDAYSCPLPPVENWLQVPIEAGEMYTG